MTKVLTMPPKTTVLRVMALMILALLVAACGTAGPTASTTTTMAEEGHDHDHTDDSRMREWDADFPAPDLQIEVNDGTLKVTAPGFVFTGADVFDPVPGEGHAHLFVNGDLMTMVYGPEFQMPRLEPGTHHVMVTLSTNDHLDYTVDGETISAMTNLEVEGEAPVSTTEPTEPEATEVVITVSDGEVDRPADRIPVELGSTVVLTVTSDVMDEVHVHGYDHKFHVMGDATSFEFVADVPGIFEVELEESGLLLFELQVG